MRALGAVFIAVAAFGAAVVAHVAPARDLTSIEISIETSDSSCPGCPASRVTFRGYGTAEFRCLGGCAVPGTQYERFPKAEFEKLVGALQDASFFDIPRVAPLGCMDCGTTTLTYRDERRIHEVVIIGRVGNARLDALVQQLRQATSVFDKYKTPSPANYETLLSEGWSPNETLEYDGLTMLNFAVYAQDAASVRFLLGRGAVVNRAALENATHPTVLEPLWTAARIAPDSAIAEALLRRAAWDNATENITWLLDKHVDVDGRDPESGKTALMAAAESVVEGAVQLLLSRGANVRARDADRNQALWYAARQNSTPSVVPLLLNAGLAVDDVNKDGRTPLMHAAESCAFVPMRELLAAGASTARLDRAGKTARDLVPTGHGVNQTESCAQARALLIGR